MLETTIDPGRIAVAVGQDAPAAGSTTEAQWQMWIDDALMLISDRVDSITPTPTIPQAKLDYVIRSAVVAMVHRPDDATQVTVSIDDGSTSKTYSRGTGQITIRDEWWKMLGLVASQGGAYAIDTAPTARAYHRDICSLTFGATYCSCGADLAGYPLWEG